jgi:hypothetical protein
MGTLYATRPQFEETETDFSTVRDGECVSFMRKKLRSLFVRALCYSSLRVLTVVVFLLPVRYLAGQTPDARTIIENSVHANEKDFEAAPEYNNKELDRTGDRRKLYQVTMIAGTPYQRLLAVDGKPLSKKESAKEAEKQRQEVAKRRAESQDERRERIAKYEKDRTRDHNMMNELAKAFDFTVTGKGRLAGFNVYILNAVPRPGYNPPNMDCQVLTGMQGKLWIDQKTYQWVKVTAEVIHPVTIEGFLARVEPGTRFELENKPVAGGIWLPSHYSMKSDAKVLFLVNRSSSADETYTAYSHVQNPKARGGV